MGGTERRPRRDRTRCRVAEPGAVATRSGAVEADVTAISLALPAQRELGIAVSIVGPSHRFPTDPVGADFERALIETVDVFGHEFRINGEDLAS